jgi:sugar (pentulose or hexulose) kinase
VVRPQLAEGTATGILLLAGLGTGLFTDLAETARKLAPAERAYLPVSQNRSRYDSLAALRQSLFASLRDSFTALADFRRNFPAGPSPSGA